MEKINSPLDIDVVDNSTINIVTPTRKILTITVENGTVTLVNNITGLTYNLLEVDLDDQIINDTPLQYDPDPYLTTPEA